MTRMLALLRAVNVGDRKVPMAELRALAAELGWSDVATYIQSGNLLFEADLSPAEAESVLEEQLARRFSFEVPVMIRTAPQWSRHAAGSPFPEAERDQPNLLMLASSKRPLAAGTAEALQARAAAGEQVREQEGALWVWYREGIARSKLTPALFDRLAGSPVTARNWRTVLQLDEMLRA